MPRNSLRLYCFHVSGLIQRFINGFLEPYLRDLAGITTLPILNKSNFEMTNIPLPPLPEQRAIARALRAVQGAREARLREMELERERKAALMEHLFTKGTRGEATKMTEIGEMPESWELKSLGEIAKIERGKFTHRPRNDPAFYGGSTPFIQTGDVATCGGLIKAYSQTLNERGLSVSKIFPRGTIVITIAANIGFTGILEFDSAFPDSLIGITPSKEVNNNYLNYFLSTQQKKMDEMAPRGTQKNINIEFLSPWPTVAPPISEQKEIATILRSCDSKIAALEQEARLHHELFRAMLEELMSGRLPAGALVEEPA
jgi:type I restriction enzyme S subunit